MRTSPIAYEKVERFNEALATYVQDAVIDGTKVYEVPLLDSSGNPVTETIQVPVLDTNGEPVLDMEGEPTYTTEEVPVMEDTVDNTLESIAYKAKIRTEELEAMLEFKSMTLPQAYTILSGLSDPDTDLSPVFGA